MIYKVLVGDDLTPLFQKMKDRGETIPNQKLCVAFVAEDQGRIVAELMIQKIDLIEPVTAEPGYGHTLGKLFTMAQEFIMASTANRVLMHPEHGAIKKMLRRVKAAPFAEFWQWLRK